MNVLYDFFTVKNLPLNFNFVQIYSYFFSSEVWLTEKFLETFLEWIYDIRGYINRGKFVVNLAS